MAAPDLQIRFVIHGRDAKFTTGFDHVFRVPGAEIIQTPFRSPRAEAVELVRTSE